MEMPGNNQTTLSSPEVKFSVELRPTTPEQLEAGKRLFKRLVERAQSSIQKNTEQKNINTKT